VNIAYLLESTELAGGVRVAVAQGDALIDLGHDVTLVARRAGPLTWRSSRARWRHVRAFSGIDARDFDFVVGTFWTTLDDAFRMAGGRAVHLCQGYEGSFSVYQPAKTAIDAAYRLPIPKITVSPHLVPLCRTFHDDATDIGQIVDDEFYQPRRQAASARPRVLLVGPMQADFKGIDIGYEAIQQARRQGAAFDLIRVSQWPPADDEPAALASEFHVGLDTRAMAAVVASCDAFLSTSRVEEGFGLPAAEALASGLPGVLTEIPSYLAWDQRRDYALFGGDGAAVGEQLARLLRDAALRDRLAARGRAVAEQFRAPYTGARLDAWFTGRAAPPAGSSRTRTSGR